MAAVPAVDLVAPRVAAVLPRGPDWIFEPKWDGYRVRLTFSGRGVEFQSRRGTNLNELFPDIVRSATVQLPTGTTLDGELVAFVDGRLSFDALQQRMAAGAQRAADLARVEPASLVVFDVLQIDSQDTTQRSWRDRRTVLEALAQQWRPPLQLTPFTDDRDEALEWMQALAPMGIEGVVGKRATGRYTRNAEWLKIRFRETLVGVIGAVVGPISAPEALIIGQVDDTGSLTVLGRTSALSPVQARAIAAHLRAPVGGHPWPETISSGQFGGRSVALTRVEPEIIAEVSADTAQMGDRRRHALRFIRLRLD